MYRCLPVNLHLPICTCSNCSACKSSSTSVSCHQLTVAPPLALLSWRLSAKSAVICLSPAGWLCLIYFALKASIFSSFPICKIVALCWQYASDTNFISSIYFAFAFRILFNFFFNFFQYLTLFPTFYSLSSLPFISLYFSFFQFHFQSHFFTIWCF